MELPKQKIQCELKAHSLATFFEDIERCYPELLLLLDRSFITTKTDITKNTETEYRPVDRIQPPNCPETNKIWLRANQNELTSEVFYAIDLHKGYGNKQSDERLSWSVNFEDQCIFRFSAFILEPSDNEINYSAIDVYFAEYFDFNKMKAIIQGLSSKLNSSSITVNKDRLIKSTLLSSPLPFHTAYALVDNKGKGLYDILSPKAQTIFQVFLPDLDPSKTISNTNEETKVQIIDRMADDLCPTTSIKDTSIENGSYKLCLFEKDVDHKALSHMASGSYTSYAILFHDEDKVVEISKRYGPSWSEGLTVEFFEPIKEDKAEGIANTIENLLDNTSQPYIKEIKKSLRTFGGFSSFDYGLTASSSLEVFNKFSNRYSHLMNLILGTDSFSSIELVDHFAEGGMDLLKKVRYMPYEVVMHYIEQNDSMQFLIFKSKALVFSISCKPGSNNHVKTEICSAIHTGDDTVTLLYLIADDLGFKTDNSFNF